MKRQSVSYDYEKVFWNTTFGIGLVALGWVSVKLGRTIGALQKVAGATGEWIKDPIKQNAINNYNNYYRWIEGADKDNLNIVGDEFFMQEIFDFRKDPKLWAAYKAEFAETYPDVEVKEGEAKPPVDIALEILNAVDKFYADYGMVMPLGILVGNVGIEYLRVRKMREELKE